MSELRVATEFSPYLGGRYRDDGPWSGEQFREEFLRPRVKCALADNSVLNILFDGVAGMPTSFLEEAFGGLLREMHDVNSDTVRSILKLHAEDPELWPFVKLAEKFMEQQAERQH
ncbi:hypothetical protein ASD38_16700 [Caulobacter sp. Root487D2Y]|uniref:STAS-like domain-containing protein n=1 Tax=Caulobacter sp. Root487D2Y TaxID=1736547 RepID=UPI0006FE6A9F|nr:STAS-like domain-containing protein [Caulobacter sp. Root487D2Y]KQY28319.1 hypothetical protein ASD38_16700 [Caulobacter sp. Root487D2Y]